MEKKKFTFEKKLVSKIGKVPGAKELEEKN